jgi:conjugative relaxase-like TrwC/TraI family protein
MGVMVSIGKLAAGQADYYLEQAGGRVTRAASVGSGAEDYYVAGNEPPGVWLGGGSRRLGLVGEVERDSLVRVLEGQYSDDGRELAAPRAGRVPGFDVTFSAPKSVSVLFGIGDEPLRRAIRSAHEAAVADALGYLERTAARGRRGEGGHTSIATSGFVAAAFRHRTSRAGDPQLHTHVLIANLVEGTDGRWSALDGRGVYQHGKTAGYLYEASLRAHLTERLGVRWTAVRNGVADIDGVPNDVLRAFSQRRAEVEAELRRRGESSAAAARMATLATRRRKDYGVMPEDLVAEWRQRATRLGFDRDGWRRVLGRARRWDEREPMEWERAFTRMASPTGLTHRRATFARRDALQALCELVPPEADVVVEELETAADRFLASAHAVPVVGAGSIVASPAIRRHDGRVVWSRLEGRFSTVELLSLERDVIATAVAGRRSGAGVVSRRTANQASQRRPLLADEQRVMVERLVADGDRVAIVIGQAGTGKTFALDAAREAWQTDGIAVLGAAVARRAARELHDGAGIESTSVAALLRRVRLDVDPLPAGCVLVIDEAGMLATRDLSEVLRAVVAADGKLVLAGDHRQLPELEAGGCFRGLSHRLPAIRLGENRRQHAVWEQRALRELRDGDVAIALAEYQRHGRVAMAPDAVGLQTRMVTDWWANGGPAGAIMIALRRTDVRALNRLARAAMAADGRLAGPELVCGGERFSAGDVVLLRQNDSCRGVANGDRGVVRSVDNDTLVVDVGGQLVTLDRAYLAQMTAHGDPVLAHGYAVTGHVAQGLTADRAFVLGSDSLYREWAYTAMSRGRDLNRLYILGASQRPRDEIAPASRRTPEQELLSGLHQSRAQVMASDTGTPAERALTHRFRRVTQERERLEAQLREIDEPRTDRRWWRRGANRGDRGTRLLAENRLAELQAEEQMLISAPLREPAPQTERTGREPERDVLER